MLAEAGVPAGSIPRRLGDELIVAARDVVEAYHASQEKRLRLKLAIDRLEELVGRP